MKSKTILIKSPNQKFEYHTSLCHSLFNPRSREGSDNHDPEAIKMHKAFQSSLPRRERQVSSDYLLDLNPISIHAPAKGATIQTYRNTNRNHDFNPRSREGSDTALFFCPITALHFNPRSREGSDLSLCYHVGLTIISIHAPAKGATFYSIPNSPTIFISIHAPAKGATVWVM